ncbi:hypothetical protein [Hungatella hathewayi]
MVSLWLHILEQVLIPEDENGLVWNFYHGRAGTEAPRSSRDIERSGSYR